MIHLYHHWDQNLLTNLLLEDIKKLNKNHIQALTPVQSFTAEHIAGFDKSRIEVLLEWKIQFFKPEQIKTLTPDQIKTLTPAQNQRLQDWLIEALNPKIYPSLEEMKNNQYSQPTIESTKLVTSELHSHKNHSEVAPVNEKYLETWTQTPELNSKPEEVKNNTPLALLTEIVVEDNKNNSQVDITNSEVLPINKDQTEIWTKITKNTINNSEAVNISSKSKQKENNNTISILEEQLEKLEVCNDKLPKPLSSKGTKKQKSLVAA